jgi:hypothetical protein
VTQKVKHKGKVLHTSRWKSLSENGIRKVAEFVLDCLIE